MNRHATLSLRIAGALCGIAVLAAPAAAHEVAYTCDLNGANVVPPSGSTATGHAELEADEHALVFDILTFTIDGIFPADLDNSHGANATAIHVHQMGHHGAASLHDPILIDLGWYISAGFGTMTATATGMDITISGVLTGIQGAYDMETATGLTPDDVFHEMEHGSTYIQVHTLTHPSGAIRGNLVPEMPVSVDATSWGEVKSAYRNE
jgi:hypothetical protein